MEEQACVPSKICAIFDLSLKNRLFHARRTILRFVLQGKQQFYCLHVLKTGLQASPEQFEKFEITFQKVKKAKFFSPGTKNRARLQGFAEMF
jgi:hypothetical protein